MANTLNNNTIDFSKEINEIKMFMSKTGNISQDELSSIRYINLTIDSLYKGKHPVLKNFNFVDNAHSIPNSTLLDKTTGNYCGSLFTGNPGIALELFSEKNKYDNKVFVPLDQLKRLKLSYLVKPEDLINVVLQNKYTDKMMSHNRDFGGKTSVDLVNIESLLKSPKKPLGLTKEQLIGYFPDFDKQPQKHMEFMNKNKKNFYNNFNDKNPDVHKKKQEYLSKVKKEINERSENSLLPKLTVELTNYKYCQLAGLEYRPAFSQEEHLKDMVNLFKKNPQELKTAIQQSGYIMQYSMNKLFNEDSFVRSQEQSLKENREFKENNPILNNMDLQREDTRSKNRSISMEAGRGR